MRDLGGVALEAGGETRYGALVRADNIRRLTDAGWRALAAHGVARIVDLRWPEELEEDPPRDVDIDVVHVSLLGDDSTTSISHEFTLPRRRRRRGRPLREVVRRILERYRDRVRARTRGVAETDGASSSTARAARIDRARGGAAPASRRRRDRR